jgi:toxin ParE1/3/4
MDGMKLRWLSPALANLDRVYEYIAQENPKAARFVFTRIQATTQKLKRFPNAGRVGQVAGTRELVVPNLPYVIVYRVTETEVQILRVWHTSQNFG